MDLDEERLGERIPAVQEIDRGGLLFRTVLPPHRSKDTRRGMFVRSPCKVFATSDSFTVEVWTDKRLAHRRRSVGPPKDELL
jgi:hypothetical protein